MVIKRNKVFAFLFIVLLILNTTVLDSRAVNPWDEYNIAPTSRTLAPVGVYHTYSSNYDYVKPGDIASELTHNMQNSGTSVANVETLMRRCSGSGLNTWISYDLKVPVGKGFALRIEETSPTDDTVKDYWVQINGVNYYHRIRTIHAGWGSTSYGGVAPYVIDVPASYASTGTITVKFLNNSNNIAGDPSISGIWTLGSESLPDVGRGGRISNLDLLLSGGTATMISNSASNGTPYLILDFGKSVAGTISFDYSCTGTQQLRLAYSNSALFSGMAGDNQTGEKPVADEAQNLYLSGNGTWTSDTLRGAFRYLMVALVNEGTLSVSNFSLDYSAVPEMSNPAAYSGYFYSNDEMINRVWYAGAYTAQISTINPNTSRGGSSLYGSWANLENCGPGTTILTDGGRRDRLVWDGDLAISFPTAYLSYNDTLSTKNALKMIYDGQDQYGKLKDCSLWPYSDFYHCWGVFSFADYYLYTKDTAFFNDYWNRFKSAMAYMTDRLVDGLYNAGGGNWSYSENNNSTEASAIVYRNLIKGAQLADIKGESVLAQSYRNTANTVKTSINLYLWDNTKGAYVESLINTGKVSTLGNSLAISYGIADSTKTESILNYFNSHMKNSTGYYTVDFSGGPIPKNNSLYVGGYLLRALVDGGRESAAVDFIRNTWGGQLNNPVGNGSTFWETLGDDGMPLYEAYDSFGHTWSTGPTSVLTEYILGVQPETPGYENYKVIPHPGGLTHVEGSVPVPGGKCINVDYDTNNINSFSMNVDSSNNSGSSGTVAIPRFGRNVVVKVNNMTVWDGTFHAITGIGNAVADSKYVYMQSVQPGSYSITTIYGTELTLTNLAKNGYASASSSIENWGWYISKLNNGNVSGVDSGWSSEGHSDPNHTEWASIDLGSENVFNRVVLYPRRDVGNEGKKFPIDFTIDVSSDNTNWESIAAYTNYPNPGANAQIFNFDPVAAWYIRVRATKLGIETPGSYALQLSELEVYNVPENYAAEGAASASTSIENWGWYLNKVNNGDTTGIDSGWSSQAHTDPNHAEWVKIDLASSETVSRVVLYPRRDLGNEGKKFPVDFTIEVSVDNMSWKTVASYTGYQNPVGSGQIFDFYPVAARYVRVTATKLGVEVPGSYAFQLSEFEIY